MAKIKKFTPADQEYNAKSAPDLDKEKTSENNLESEEIQPEALEQPIEVIGDSSPKQVKDIREAIEKTKLDDSLKNQASSQAQDLKLLEEEKKVKKLLELAKSKGVVYAINVAKKMDDPYILDMMHDILAKEGYYKNFKF